VKNVMLDLETLGTVASSVIMSIGAVKFDLEAGTIDDAGFYASVSIDSNLLAGRQVSEETLLWWMKQDKTAQKVFFEPKQPLDAALEDFSRWFGDGREAEKTLIWSNGADFDIPMMVHAYHLYGWEAPWAYYNTRCFRTVKNSAVAQGVVHNVTGIKHNALTDAINQVKHLQAIHDQQQTLSRLAGKVAA
jgi:hypothetical protein